MTGDDIFRTVIAASTTFFLILAVWIWFMNRRK